MGMFDKVEDAKASVDGGSYVRAGHYIARIDRVKADKSQQNNDEFVAVEMTVLSTLPDGDIPVDADFNSLGKENWHAAGEQFTHLMMTKHASFLGNMKAFVANIGGMPEVEVDSDTCEEVTNGVFEGLFIELRARTIRTRAGKPFTKVGYVREVPPLEISDRLGDDECSRLLGVGKIAELIAEYEE